VANIYKKKGTRFLWAWGFDAFGKRWDESTKQTDPKAARLAARNIERRHAEDPDRKARPRLSVEAAIELVLEYQRESGKAQATVRATSYHGRHLFSVFGPKKMLSDVTLADTTSYLRKRLKEGAHRHTIAKEIRTLTQAMRRAEKLGLHKAERSPGYFVPDELGSFYEPRQRWLTRDEYQRLLVALGNRYRESDEDRRDYVIAWCNLGLRKSELFDVRPGDYDASRRELRVRGTKTKNADRLVPVNDDAAAALERRCKLAKPFPSWTDGNCTRDLAKACKRAGIATVTPNDLRRTFCSWLCQAGVSERVCAELMGHGSTVMVRAVYGHLDREGMAAAVSRIATAPATDSGTSGDSK
jgi:integrase